MIMGMLLTMFASCSFAVNLCEGKQIIGATEAVLLLDQKITLEAKIDTGAAMSSISAKNIRVVKDSVTFELNGNKEITLPLVNYVKILKRADESGESTVRPIVTIPICVGAKKLVVNVNLIDRSQFKYPMLIGAATLRELHVVVDPGRHDLTIPKCVG